VPKRKTPQRKPRRPYIKRLYNRRGVEAWLVDGSYIRKNIDEEFSNFGHHGSFDCIPKNEIWLDQESDPDEHRFFLAHASLERRLMLAGKDYDSARRQANKVERKMRIATGDLRKLTEGHDLPQPERVHTRLLKKLNNGVTVWLVDGRLVRSAFDIEFTEGGHEHVYEYVPRDEVWIDDDVHDDERGFVLLHELFERRLMSEGITYDEAHEQASKREGYLRHHPAELHEALADEGWE
jgi:hypothetical protein